MPDDESPSDLAADKAANRKRTGKVQKHVSSDGSHNLDAQRESFARFLFKTGSESASYLRAYPECMSTRAAKSRGRALAQEPAIIAFISALRAQAVDSEGNGLSADELGREAWEAELRAMAFAPLDPGRLKALGMTAKEKLAALRTMGESKKWLGSGVAPAGLRATFTFNISSIAGRARSRGPLTLEGEAVDNSSGLPDKEGEAFQISPPHTPPHSNTPPTLGHDTVSRDGQVPADDGHPRAHDSHAADRDNAPPSTPRPPRAPLFDAANT